MKDSTKLFTAAVFLIIAGYIKGVAPTALEQPFDVGSFMSILIIAIIVIVLGIIKLLRNK